MHQEIAMIENIAPAEKTKNALPKDTYVLEAHLVMLWVQKMTTETLSSGRVDLLSLGFPFILVVLSLLEALLVVLSGWVQT